MNMKMDNQKIIVTIKEDSLWARMATWRLKSKAVAMVFGRTIHLWGVTRSGFLASPSWVRHELKHVEQYQKLGKLGFLWQYIIESIRNGYYRNKFEVEARHAEKEDTHLSRFEIREEWRK